jgi:hypothetical protein
MPQSVWWMRTISSVPTQPLRDRERPDLVVGHHPARVPDHVHVALVEAQHPRRVQPTVHARDHRDLLRRRQRQIALFELRGVPLVVGDQFVGDAIGTPSRGSSKCSKADWISPECPIRPVTMRTSVRA